MSRLDRIREQVPVGSEVRFTLRDGTAAQGILTETDPEMVILQPIDGCVETVFIDAIVHWKVLKRPESGHVASPVNGVVKEVPLAADSGTHVVVRTASGTILSSPSPPMPGPPVPGLPSAKDAL